MRWYETHQRWLLPLVTKTRHSSLSPDYIRSFTAFILISEFSEQKMRAISILTPHFVRSYLAFSCIGGYHHSHAVGDASRLV